PLPPNTPARLVYVLIGNRLYISINAESRLKTVWVPVDPGELRQRIEQYKEECSSEPNRDLNLPPLDEDSRRLFAIFLQPVISDLPKSGDIVVDADPLMRGLPLEALKSSEGWYFGEKYPVIYSPGYAAERKLREPSPQVPQSGLSVDTLFSQTESATLRNLFPGLLRRDDATLKPWELARLLDSKEMVAFVGHAEKGALVLNNGTRVRGKDFPAESLRHLQLAVLAACSTNKETREGRNAKGG